MKWPVGKLTTSCLLCIRQLKGEMLVPLEAALERNCAARSEQRGGTSKLGLVQPPMPTRPRTPPGVGTRCRRLDAQVNVTRRRIRRAR